MCDEEDLRSLYAPQDDRASLPSCVGTSFYHLYMFRDVHPFSFLHCTYALEEANVLLRGALASRSCFPPRIPFFVLEVMFSFLRSLLRFVPLLKAPMTSKSWFLPRGPIFPRGPDSLLKALSPSISWFPSLRFLWLQSPFILGVPLALKSWLLFEASLLSKFWVPLETLHLRSSRCTSYFRGPDSLLKTFFSQPRCSNSLPKVLFNLRSYFPSSRRTAA